MRQETVGSKKVTASAMSRFVLVTVLVGAMAVAAKLVLKPPAVRPPLDLPLSQSAPSSASSAATEPAADLRDQFPAQAEWISSLVDRYGHNARRIAASDGLAGLRLLEQLGDAAVCLYEVRPREFRQLARATGDRPEAARLAGNWASFLDPRLAERDVTATLVHELARLPAWARRHAEETPESLPFLLCDYRRTAQLLEAFGPGVLDSLAFLDLSDGGSSLDRAIDVFDRHGRLALDAARELGPAGFMLVERHGALIAELEPEVGCRGALLVVAAGLDDIDELAASYRSSAIARCIVHLKHRGLLDLVAGHRYGLRLAMEYGRSGEEALETAGPRVAEIAYVKYTTGPSRNAVVHAVAQGGAAAAAAAERYAESQSFQQIVLRDGVAAVLAVAAACSAEETRAFLDSKTDRTWSEALALAALRLAGDSADRTIRAVERDGIDRFRELADPEIRFQEFLPLYDLSHLGSVVLHGYVPTRGEFAWAGLDAGFVMFDALSLAALQPEGVAAAEATRASVKATARAALKNGSRAVVEQAAEAAASHGGRAAAASAGRAVTQTARAVAASERSAAHASAELAESLAARAGMRLTFAHYFEASSDVLAAVPRTRLTKYVAANAAQAGVGLLAVRKMEEYLEGRSRPAGADTGPSAGGF